MALARHSAARFFPMWLAATAVGCSGSSGGSSRDGSNPGDDTGPGDDDPWQNPGDDGGETPVVMPSFVGIHRLNGLEYDNTIRDLLGVDARLARGFIPDEEALGFDNIASALGMTPAQYEQYFNAASDLAEKTFADDGLRGRVMTCDSDDDGCLRTIIGDFGLRAWRRPLADGEIDRLVALAGEAKMLGEDFTGQVRHVVATMLASVPFLYRLELDPADQDQPRRLDGYELASRLSYLLWRTMPDDELFAQAAGGALTRTNDLRAQVDRMLGDARAAELVDGFAGQWLGIRDLETHQVLPEVYPAWDDDLRAALIGEANLFFEAFLASDGPGIESFFTIPLKFVNTRLASHYGVEADGGAEPVRITDALAERPGFLGTGAFLTTTSFVHRTSPTNRGVWIYSNLLCEELPEPPANVPELDEGGAQTEAASQNVRERLAAHRENPACASCHSLFDPMGLGLETFDAIGRARSKYPNGDDIDASGELPDGTRFSGVKELSEILAKDERFPACLAEKLFVYAHSRGLSDEDEAALAGLRTRWGKNELKLRALVEDMVLGETFRSRRPEPATQP